MGYGHHQKEREGAPNAEQTAELLEKVRLQAASDMDAGAILVYSAGKILAGMKNDEFIIFKSQLKGILGDALDRNQLGTIRNAAIRVEHERCMELRIQATKEAILDHRDPIRSARELMKRHFLQDGMELVRRHATEFWEYVGTHYEMRPNEYIRSRVYPFLDQSKVMGPDGPIAFQPTAAHVNDTIDAWRSLVGVFIEQEAAPCWVGPGQSPFNPTNVVAFANGLLDIERWQRDPRAPLIPHTPAWFSTYALPFAYKADATCPTWLHCLSQWFDGDAESILALQLWFGLLLTADTSFQKILFLLGPPRSGKGCIIRVLRALIGPNNFVGPTLNSLAGEFGLAPLIGKPLACIPDAHMGRSTDAAMVLDRLKSISGEDAVSINRKHKDAITLRLSTRFMIALNRMLDFPDPSGALAARLIVLTTRRSFIGSEDLTLDAKLEAELPGIASWSLHGLAQLRQRGVLLQPASSASEVEEFRRASSPIAAFVEEYCVTPVTGSVDISRLYDAWKFWCAEEGHQPGSKSTFGGKLTSAFPHIAVIRPRSGEVRTRRYGSIALNNEGIAASGGLRAA